MPSHRQPPVPPAGRSTKGPALPGTRVKLDPRLKHPPEDHASEQGDTANVRQNTTSKGGARGLRMK